MPRIKDTATTMPTPATEVMGGEASHLSEIAHGALRRVGLPVGVGGEAGGGVPGQIGPTLARCCGLKGRST